MPQPIVPAQSTARPRLSPSQRAQRHADYHAAAHIREPARWFLLSGLWGVSHQHARAWCRWQGLYQTEADQQQNGKVESRHELRQWWLKRIAR
jgi:hypothetical protein